MRLGPLLQGLKETCWGFYSLHGSFFWTPVGHRICRVVIDEGLLGSRHSLELRRLPSRRSLLTYCTFDNYSNCSCWRYALAFSPCRGPGVGPFWGAGRGPRMGASSQDMLVSGGIALSLTKVCSRFIRSRVRFMIYQIVISEDVLGLLALSLHLPFFFCTP